MTGHEELVAQAEHAARKTIRAWIRRALRESFLQGIRQVWTVRPRDDDDDDQRDGGAGGSAGAGAGNDDSCYKVELSASGLRACFGLVERVSRAWQQQLRDEHHGRAARWVEEVYRRGKPTLWADPAAGDGDDNNDDDDDDDGDDYSDDCSEYNGGSECDSDRNRNGILKWGDDNELVRGEKTGSSSSSSVDEATEIDVSGAIATTNTASSNSNSNSNSNDGSDVDKTRVRETPTETQSFHPNVYSRLRSLGRKHEINDSVMSVSDALRELRSNNDNDDGHHPTTHWPLGNEIIDRAAVELSHRMRARDRHGSGGGSSNSGAVRNGVDADGNVYYTKKTVRFKVVPKSTATTSTVTSAATAAVDRERDGSDDHDHDHDHDHDDEKDAGQTLMTTTTTLSTIAEGGDEPSRIAALMLASRKRKGTKGSSSLQSQSARKKARASFLLPWDVPRPPSDAALPVDGVIPTVLTRDEKKALDRLLMLDDDDDDDDDNDGGDKDKDEKTPPLAPTLGLFGGLQYVGQTNHLVKNKTTTTTTTNIGLPFLSKENTNKIARRKERVSIQERLDPNRIQAGRGENPVDRNSKFLRTEDWFDERKKFFDFDLGWSLLEIPAGRDGDQKKLCAFSSLEVCLGDHD